VNEDALGSPLPGSRSCVQRGCAANVFVVQLFRSEWESGQGTRERLAFPCSAPQVAVAAGAASGGTAGVGAAVASVGATADGASEDAASEGGTAAAGVAGASEGALEGGAALVAASVGGGAGNPTHADRRLGAGQWRVCLVASFRPRSADVGCVA
jgi:hypothetical protein